MGCAHGTVRGLYSSQSRWRVAPTNIPHEQVYSTQMVRVKCRRRLWGHGGEPTMHASDVGGSHRGTGPHATGCARREPAQHVSHPGTQTSGTYADTLEATSYERPLRLARSKSVPTVELRDIQLLCRRPLANPSLYRRGVGRRSARALQTTETTHTRDAHVLRRGVVQWFVPAMPQRLRQGDRRHSAPQSVHRAWLVESS